jgi:hypothetical protein
VNLAGGQETSDPFRLGRHLRQSMERPDLAFALGVVGKVVPSPLPLRLPGPWVDPDNGVPLLDDDGSRLPFPSAFGPVHVGDRRDSVGKSQSHRENHPSQGEPKSLIIKMEPVVGIEPTTYGLRNRRKPSGKKHQKAPQTLVNTGLFARLDGQPGWEESGRFDPHLVGIHWEVKCGFFDRNSPSHPSPRRWDSLGLIGIRWEWRQAFRHLDRRRPPPRASTPHRIPEASTLRLDRPQSPSRHGRRRVRLRGLLSGSWVSGPTNPVNRG